ncbi:phosphoenolpyruvate--protein phosphotransferase [Ereboglobus luteus]|uniref:Phosphoenolpyruvate-protein phosphotransferase n=1 Tax=Ereboglobus luteus TaxID=1796921 RepID=A0A2U8E6I0_9BACT|nr:phosphoenolpyruvate--protein phosphotransferase [Ereboglobus luteus]AWI10477.1 phosphoenolpyruvate--protein phosphotransferase [Ereboglobus luteus]
MDARNTPEIIIHGIAASPGIAHGQILLHIQSDLELPEYQISPEQRAEEMERFDRALVATRQQIQQIRNEVEKNLGTDEARIFDAHLLVLEDVALIGETEREFETSSKNIEWCFNNVVQRYIKAFSEIDDEYLGERAGDIRDVAQRVLQNLLGRAQQTLNNFPGNRVVVANDVSPSDAVGMDRDKVLAIVTDSGSRTSHAVIVARTMRVPAVVATRDLTKRIVEGDSVLVDGYEGTVIINPSDKTLYRYGKIQVTRKSVEQRMLDAVSLPSVTQDGVEVILRANIEGINSAELDMARRYSAQGVGLYRTEFLYMQESRMPSEEEQYRAYKAVVENMAGEIVTIRTLDLGGDKLMNGKSGLFPMEANPFLGMRAIRFCLEHKEIFKNQLRAILRASAHGRVLLMYPMISGTGELDDANKLLDECRAELREKGVAFDEKMPVGTMIEVPSAATTADILAPKADFFSIGTNDLIQYLLAIDRSNERIAHLYKPAHPSVLRMLSYVVEQAHKAKIKVSVCGEMAGDPLYVPLLLGIGVDELSMASSLIPAVKYLVRAMKMSDAKKLVHEASKMDNAAKITALCNAFYNARMAEA